MQAFTYTLDKDAIALVTFDLPGGKVNKLTSPALDELDLLLDDLSRRQEIKAAVFRSGKTGGFIAGADIAEISAIGSAETGERLAARGQEIFRKLERLPFPTVAAIHGACMGGGLELALACTYRIATDDSKTVFALPEVKLGILPGFGGTQRLPRLLGLTNSLDMILTGKTLSAAKARKIGLIDEIAFKETLLDAAHAKAVSAQGKTKPNRIRAKRPWKTAFIESNRLTREIAYRISEKRILYETRGNYPAPLAALEAVRQGLEKGPAVGFAYEAKMLGKLAVTDEAKNLISLFYLREDLKKGHGAARSGIRNAGVLGAGIMGGAIAQLLTEKGIPVRVKDISTRSVGAGLKEAWAIFRSRHKKGVLSGIQARDGFDRISGTTDYSGFQGIDLAIEAVVENIEVKKTVLREFEKSAKPGAIFASNTSSLSITEIAGASGRPERVAGMHFFNPVEKMPLIEIVQGEKTAPETVAEISALAVRLGKLPVIVRDGPGFLVNRILMPYLLEATAILEQGSSIEKIDQSLLGFGMPMGAFMLLDEIGIDVAHKVVDILHAGLGERARPSPLLGRLHEKGYFGRKNRKGFYVYKGRKRGNPDQAIAHLMARGNQDIGRDEIVERTILLMVKEAALCLEEKITTRPDHLDAALIFGIGFPPFRGGLLRYADRIGAPELVRKLHTYTDRYGMKFSPPRSLLDMATRNRGFYE